MTIQFDSNDHALDSGELTVYAFDSNGIYSDSYTAQIVIGSGLPANTTTIAPPAVQSGHAAVFQNGAWDIVEDHRGTTVWDSKTGAHTVISQVGPLPENVTTIEPEQAKQQRLKEQAQTELQTIMNQAPSLTVMGEVFGPNTRECVQKLRTIANGTDTTSTELPAVPSDLTT